MNAHHVFDQSLFTRGPDRRRSGRGARLRTAGCVIAALSLTAMGTATATAMAPGPIAKQVRPAVQTWTTTPLPADDMQVLVNDVVSFGGSDAWAVGENEVNDVPFETAESVLRWNGTAWADTGPTTLDGALVAVAGNSSNDLWTTGTETAGPVALHFNGTTWTTMSLPDTTLGSVTPTDIAVAGTNAWVVGNIDVGFPLTKAGILEWTGSAWVAQPLPPNADGQTELNSVYARNNTDVWAVGSQRKDASSEFKPYVLHWNGTVWSEITTPFQRTDSLLNAVLATGPNQILVGGQLGNQGDASDLSFAMSWNGTTWTTNTVPNNDPGPNFIKTLGFNGTTPWAGGTTDTSVLSFDGTAWQNASRPVSEFPFGFPRVDSIGAIPGGGLWAVGHGVGTSGDNFISFIARFS